MSYHGGVIGVVTAIWLFSRKVKLHLFELADFLTAAIPLGYFFNKENDFKRTNPKLNRLYSLRENYES